MKFKRSVGSVAAVGRVRKHNTKAKKKKLNRKETLNTFSPDEIYDLNFVYFYLIRHTSNNLRRFEKMMINKSLINVEYIKEFMWFDDHQLPNPRFINRENEELFKYFILEKYKLLKNLKIKRKKFGVGEQIC